MSICRCCRRSFNPHWLWVLMKASIRAFDAPSGEARRHAACSAQLAVRGSSCQPPQGLSFELHHLHALHVTVFVTLRPVPYALSSAFIQLRRCCRVADVTPSLVLDCVPWPTLCSFLAQVECCKCCPLATQTVWVRSQIGGLHGERVL